MADEKKTSKKADAEKADKTAKKKSRKNPFKSIASFFKSVKAEGKKVTWAKGKDVLKNTVVVLVVCVIAGIAIFAVDTALTQGMGALKKAAATTTTTTTTAAAQQTSGDNEKSTAPSDKSTESTADKSDTKAE